MIVPDEYAIYATYETLSTKLKDLEREFPDLVKIESAGRSRQGRDLWVATVTNRLTGDASSKPAMYIDGNHHASEVTGSAVCLYTIAYLVANYGVDPFVTQLLDTRAFYVLPRVSPDGAEIFLTTPYSLRSTPRLWPLDREDDGIVPEDINGDGKILQMRIPDPDGEFKVSDKDPRLMVRRMPDETGGQYYKVFTEGLVRGYDGAELRMATPKWGLDLNRNYPINWGGEVKQPGSGPYPLSEPETRSVADFVASKKNIAAVMSYHTTGGIILRPRCTAGDTEIPAKDLAIYVSLGRRGTEITGYPCKSIFEGFTRDKKKPSVGSFLDFSYDHLGIISFATELWNLRKRAGIPDRDMAQLALLSEREEEEDGLKVLRWIDSELGGEGFVPWTKVRHPQLGEVEVGGIDHKFVITNPPPRLLKQECHKNMLFTLSVAAATPFLVLDSPEAKHLGNDVWSVSVVVRNSGYMPTSGSEQAVATRCVRPVEAKIDLPEGARLVSGKEIQEVGHLPGRALGAGSLSVSGWRKKVSWIIDLKGTSSERSVLITVEGSRGGRPQKRINLD